MSDEKNESPDITWLIDQELKDSFLAGYDAGIKEAWRLKEETMSDENKTTPPSLPEFIQLVKESKAMTENESSKCLQAEYLQATIIAVENGYLVCTNDKQYVFDTLGQATVKLLAHLGQPIKKELWPLILDEINYHATEFKEGSK